MSDSVQEIKGNFMDINNFVKSYWNYYIELEKRMEETRRYVEYDECNHNTYSSNYLMLFQTVCSEIDVVGKELAAYYYPDFENENGSKPINRWWYEIQDQLPNVFREISFAGSYNLNPWKNFRINKVISHQMRNGNPVDVTNYNLQQKNNGITYSTPSWWNAYNKVKHKKLHVDNDGVNYKKANQINISNSFAALYLLEFEFLKQIGTVEERIKYCSKSVLFGMGELQYAYIDALIYDEENETATFINTK